MDDTTRRTIELECVQLTARFFNHVDQGRFREAASMVAPNGTWYRSEGTVTGPDQVMTALEKRDPSRITVHVITNIVARVIDEANAEVQALVMPYHAAPPASGKGPGTEGGVGAMIRTTELWNKTGDGWRLVDKKNQPLMRFPAH